MTNDMSDCALLVFASKHSAHCSRSNDMPNDTSNDMSNDISNNMSSVSNDMSDTWLTLEGEQKIKF